MSAPETMSFDESVARARAEHVVVETFYQPGNGYREEHRCRCGMFVFATSWDAHVLAAADAYREGFRIKGSLYWQERVPL